MNAPRRSIGLFLTAIVLAGLGAALLTQNLRNRGPFHLRERTLHGVYDVRIIRRGWPFASYERTDVSITIANVGLPPETYRLPATIKRPAMDVRNPQSWAIVGNVTLGLLMLASTAIVAEYWRRHRTGPFQFSLRSMLIATALVAAILALIDENVMPVSALLYLPLAVGLVSLPAVGGLVLQYYVRRSDQRLSELRSRYTARRQLV
jgi:hypothetical protein